MTPAHQPPPHTPTAPARHTAYAAAHPIRPDTTARHRARRILAAVITAATLVVAGIGFAGSYTAVRELAIKKGFGNFSYVFPIGIDAGICVLLALDLLLTWIRIPLPLLRQTAWLLTAATIAFNGAAAWPDPLGTGMHAVIPILFVVAVEAARHAIGRIADITADKHMEGVRLTRWLLSPLPTFLLWRRMKLWELRSYEQVIKLEQERLVYQARLHSRFGRTWRRKAPVESLMPLRLARYGVPLSETAPAGLAAAGIEPVLLPPAPQPAIAADAPAPLAAAAPRAAEAAPERQQHPAQQHQGQHSGELLLKDPSPQATGTFPGPAGPHHTRQLGKGIDTPAPRPAPAIAAGPTSHPRHGASPSTWRDHGHERGTSPATHAPAAPTPPLTSHTESGNPMASAGQVHAGVSPTVDPGTPHTVPAPGSVVGPQATGPRNGATAHHPPHTPPAAARARRAKRTQPLAPGGRARPPTSQGRPQGEQLTAPDRYYLAWMQYQSEHGTEPTAEQLSAHLAHQGLLGRSRRPVSPANLRRHFLRWRVYNIWAEHRQHTQAPSSAEVAQECAARGITGQYNRPVTPRYITDETPDFERRRHALTTHHTPTHP